MRLRIIRETRVWLPRTPAPAYRRRESFSRRTFCALVRRGPVCVLLISRPPPPPPLSALLSPTSSSSLVTSICAFTHPSHRHTILSTTCVGIVRPPSPLSGFCCTCRGRSINFPPYSTRSFLRSLPFLGSDFRFGDVSTSRVESTGSFLLRHHVHPGGKPFDASSLRSRVGLSLSSAATSKVENASPTVEKTLARPIIIDIVFSEMSDIFRLFELCVQASRKMKRLDFFLRKFIWRSAKSSVYNAALNP